MRNQCTATIIMRTDLKSRRTGMCPMALQCFINGERKVIALNLYLPPEVWDKETKKILDKSGAYKDYTLLLNDALAKANKIFIDYRLQQLDLTAKKFEEEFSSGSSRVDFLKYYETEMNRKRKDKVITFSTWKQNGVTLQKLREYQSSIPFNEINHKWLEKFNAWHKRRLVAQAKERKLPLINEGINTLRVAQKNIRTYLYAARADGIKFSNPFEKIKIGAISGRKEFLEPSELKRLNKMISDDNLRPALRDVLHRFLFSCFTGLRISDSREINSAQIDGDILVFKPAKTIRQQKEIRIPLNKAALSFITNLRGRLFNSITDQQTNLHLKEIAILAGIKKKLSFHVSRHTFGALFIYQGGKVEVLQQLMGHSDIRTTMQYVHLANELKQKREQLNRMDDLLE